MTPADGAWEPRRQYVYDGLTVDHPLHVVSAVRQAGLEARLCQAARRQHQQRQHPCSSHSQLLRHIIVARARPVPRENQRREGQYRPGGIPRAVLQ